MKTDTEFLAELQGLLNGPKNFAANLSKSKKYKELYNWIITKTTPLLSDSFYTISTKIFYILHNFSELPKCANPNCGNIVKTNFSAYSNRDDYYNKACCVKCIQYVPAVKAKIENTTLKKYGCKRGRHDANFHDSVKKICLEKYGVESPLASNEIREKIKKTNIKKYGCENIINSQIIKDKIHTTILSKYGVNTPFESPIIQDKIKTTNIKKYGVTNQFDRNDIQEKIKETNIKKYGKKTYLGSDDCKKKTMEYCQTNYGVNSILQIPSIREKIKETNIKKYGVEIPFAFGSPEFAEIMVKKYGCSHTSYSPELQRIKKTKYNYNNIMFDSAPELAFYIWLSDNNFNFIYKPNTSFEYYCNDIAHKYYPDFLVDGQYIEIKGDHFFKDGKMICPYRDANWTDDDYQKMCDRYEAKHQCMLANKVKILTQNEYIIYVDYVANLYGNNYLDTFKKR